MDLRTLAERPGLIYAALIMLAFVAASGAVVVSAMQQEMLRVGQIMADTRLARLDFQVLDEEATAERREEARDAAPRVYRLNTNYLDSIEKAIEGLPNAVAGKTSLDEIRPELQQEFGLDEAALEALQPYSVDGEPTSGWAQAVQRLIAEQLVRQPIIESAEYQIYSTTANRAALVGGEVVPLRASAIELTRDSPAAIAPRLEQMIAEAGFPEPVRPVVRHRLLRDPQPTYVYAPEATTRLAEQAAQAVPPVFDEHEKGEILYSRGEVLTAAQYQDVLAEHQAFVRDAPLAQQWIPRLGAIGLILVMTLFMTAYITIAYPRIIRNPLRAMAIVVLMVAMLGLTVIISMRAPNVMLPAAVAPTLFVTLIVMLAYDQRLAIFVGGVQSVLVCLALSQGIAWFVLLLSGCGAMVAQLREVRHRNTLMRASAVTAAFLAAATIVWGMLTMPFDPGPWLVWQTILMDALLAAAASFAVGFIVLGTLPSIERLFDITTGMTLAELRDPKQPLLRQLQQKAPGTYNHSLQVATVAEAAADAIGADSLLVYVGALYHDIGKMNKPQYFIENQSDGQNKHERLKPAMSLLVIVGHVKDGVELAREYGLPRKIQHFIESHHGTTLVEYFYHAARTEAETDHKKPVEEVEFRYPGPKPQTREAAILMLADAVESATRAMADPNPASITNLVKALSRKRLMDGQFDQCDLTFRELTLIEEAIISRILAIHHGRIRYPSAATRADREEERPRPATAAAAARSA